ncbi:MAG: tRNA (N6-isopentenyl adenosine(37)-C2)-methylthiotransferase MiaB [Myxococcota bacterium]|nr:tRNA (N6-isopentenyl adenosine(37)-C2)-methylthiotransferase MiaB [Myxococcota bacterium]
MSGIGDRSARREPAARRFSIRTYGCQMNVHDSEKVANLLHHAGYEAAASEDDADLLIVNTCSIREKAEHHLYSDLGKLREWKDAGGGRVIGVGGCVAQRVGDAILTRFSQVDFVFGTHNVRHVAAMADAGLRGERSARTEETDSNERFSLPERHPGYSGSTPGRAFLTVMEGCDMFCSFCIVPMTRGREISRKATEILAEACELAASGVREVTLLGQTVNAYGRHDTRRGHSEQVGTMPFGRLLREISSISGIERIRYTSPHPLFFDDNLVRAHADLASLCPHVHLPLQSGSDRVLERMRRRYTRAGYLDIVRALKDARPDIALTTDLIVGFPGETEDDFQQTLELVEEAGFVDQYSFKYSPRPGTKAAEFAPAEEVPGEVAQERLERLQGLQRQLTLRYHRRRIEEDGATRVLVEGPSRRGGNQLCGRDPYHRVVNFDAGGLEERPAPGEIVELRLVEAMPNSLIGQIGAGVAAGEPAVASSSTRLLVAP